MKSTLEGHFCVCSPGDLTREKCGSVQSVDTLKGRKCRDADFFTAVHPALPKGEALSLGNMDTVFP